MIELYNNIPQDVLDALKYDTAKQRFLFYTDKLDISNYLTGNYYEQDNKICYSESIVKPKMGTRLYLYRSNKKGFTYDKQTKKISIWFASQIKNMSKLNLFLIAIGKEWVVNEKLIPWLTKTILEKILSGTITNPKQACKFIIQQSRLKISPENLRQYIKNDGNKFELLSIKDVISDLNIYTTNQSRIDPDIIKQAKALGRIINVAWSTNRLKEVHQEWTEEIMSRELEDMKDEKIKYPELNLPNKPPVKFELINSKKRLFQEGSIMHHCIFTNYWERIRKKKYMALHVTDKDGNEATAGIHINGIVKLDTVLSKYNKPPSRAITIAVNKLLKDYKFKETLINANKKYETN